MARTRRLVPLFQHKTTEKLLLCQALIIILLFSVCYITVGNFCFMKISILMSKFMRDITVTFCVGVYVYVCLLSWQISYVSCVYVLTKTRKNLIRVIKLCRHLQGARRSCCLLAFSCSTFLRFSPACACMCIQRRLLIERLYLYIN